MSISRQTVTRRFSKVGINARKVRKMASLSAENKRTRLSLAKKYQTLTATDYRKVILSVENNIEVSNNRLYFTKITLFTEHRITEMITIFH